MSRMSGLKLNMMVEQQQQKLGFINRKLNTENKIGQLCEEIYNASQEKKKKMSISPPNLKPDSQFYQDRLNNANQTLPTIYQDEMDNSPLLHHNSYQTIQQNATMANGRGSNPSSLLSRGKGFLKGGNESQLSPQILSKNSSLFSIKQYREPPHQLENKKNLLNQSMQQTNTRPSPYKLIPVLNKNNKGHNNNNAARLRVNARNAAAVAPVLGQLRAS